MSALNPREIGQALERLAQERLRPPGQTRELSQDEIAKRTGLTQSKVSRLFRGQGITLENLDQFLERLNLTPADFFADLEGRRPVGSVEALLRQIADEAAERAVAKHHAALSRALAGQPGQSRTLSAAEAVAEDRELAEQERLSDAFDEKINSRPKAGSEGG